MSATPAEQRWAVCRAAPRDYPAAMLKRNLTSLSAFATPAENPSRHRHHGGRCEPLTWISNFYVAYAERLTISPRVALSVSGGRQLACRSLTLNQLFAGGEWRQKFTRALGGCPSVPESL